MCVFVRGHPATIDLDRHVREFGQTVQPFAVQIGRQRQVGHQRQLAGEARNPKRDLSRAILTAMAIGAIMYALLQVVMIGALEPANIVKGWTRY